MIEETLIQTAKLIKAEREKRGYRVAVSPLPYPLKHIMAVPVPEILLSYGAFSQSIECCRPVECESPCMWVDYVFFHKGRSRVILHSDALKWGIPSYRKFVVIDVVQSAHSLLSDMVAWKKCIDRHERRIKRKEATA